MYNYERILCEMHFRKLVLISKLMIAANGELDFKRVEANSKRIIELKHKKRSKEHDEWQKFTNEDAQRLQSAFTQQYFPLSIIIGK